MNLKLTLASPAVKCPCGTELEILTRPGMGIDSIKSQVVTNHICAFTVLERPNPVRKLAVRRPGPQGSAQTLFYDPFAGMVADEDSDEAMGMPRRRRRRR